MKCLKNRVLPVALLGIAGVLPALSIPAKPGLLQVNQPDGTTVEIYLKGDERGHSVYSSDGYLLTNDSEGYYVFADKNAEGLLVPTSIREINPQDRSAMTKDAISRIDQVALSESVERMRSAANNGMMRGPGLMSTQFPSSGEQKSLVILVEFQNKEFTIENPNEYFHRMLNEEGFSDNSSTGSARDYFVANSSGKFLPDFDVFGPVTLSHDYSYYGQNDGWGNDARPHEMVIEACELLDDEIDFSFYDRNEDGKIDNVYVFYAGYGEADGGGSNTVWPHSWDISQATWKKYNFDGVRLDHYACSNELQQRGNLPDGIGAFCHEFSHVMGLPDLYATTYTSAFTPGSWSLLDGGSYNNNSRTPPNYSAFERYALDWMEPRALDYGEQTLMSIGESNEAFIVFTEVENEYFLIENRQQEGFDTYIPGHGMLVWHVDYKESVWNNNTVNNQSSHQYVDLIEADNTQSEWTRGGDSFPGNSGITEFTCLTKPAFVSWKREPLPYHIIDIEESEDGVITFNVDGCISTGISAMGSNGNLISVNGNKVSLHREDIKIYDISGRQMNRNNAKTLALSSGIYVAVSGKDNVKFIVK